MRARTVTHLGITMVLATLFLRSELCGPSVHWVRAGGTEPSESPPTAWAKWVGHWEWLHVEELAIRKQGAYAFVGRDDAIDASRSGEYVDGVRVGPWSSELPLPTAEPIELRVDDPRLTGSNYTIALDAPLHPRHEDRFHGERHWHRSWSRSGLPQYEGASLGSDLVDEWTVYHADGGIRARGTVQGPWNFWRPNGDVDEERTGRQVTRDDLEVLLQDASKR